MATFVADPASTQICQRIASAMDGTLSAESGGRNRGTTFTFSIPLVVPESPPSSPDTPLAPPPELGAAKRPGLLPPSPPARGSDSPPQPLRVLVAEDDPLCAAVMRKILERLNVAGTIVGDGAAAVSAYSDGAPRAFLQQRRARLSPPVHRS